ncbi:MAG: bacteriohemerythrin [Deltaproteobacteria bacterium]|nr:bacteriohemerythrin [Deltaproteobacteria bacterium]
MKNKKFLEPDQSKLKQAYDRFVPQEFFKLLGKEDITKVKLGDQVERTMTVLFSDIRNFTSLSESMSPQKNFDFINSYLSQMEPVISNHGGIVDKYVGDAIMVLFPNSADDALKGSIAMLGRLDSINQKMKKEGYNRIEIGIGLNTGLLMLGTVGAKHRMEGTVISDAVNLASRIEGLTKLYGASLLISEYTYYHLNNVKEYHIRFIDRVLVKGKTQPQSIYEVFSADEVSVREAKSKTTKIFEEALANYHLKRVDKAQNLLQKCLDANPKDAPAQFYMDRCKRFLSSGVHEGSGEIDANIVWNESLKVGVKEIDEQHKELFEYSNVLMNAIKERREQNEVEKVVSFLNEYVKNHFRDEEKIMQEHNYPFLSFQKEQHENFIKYFKKVQNELKEMKESRAYLMFRIRLLVVDWLVNHTYKEDRHFGRFLRDKD